MDNVELLLGKSSKTIFKKYDNNDQAWVSVLDGLLHFIWCVLS